MVDDLAKKVREFDLTLQTLDGTPQLGNRLSLRQNLRHSNFHRRSIRLVLTISLGLAGDSNWST